MNIFIESQDLDVWNVIVEGPFVFSIEVHGESQPKHRNAWKDDKKKVHFDLKAKNILTSALDFDEFFRVSNCKSAKKMWDTLKNHFND